MTDAVLIAAVRRRLGKVSDIKQIIDTDITEEGAYILKIIAQRCEVRELRPFLSKADTRDYDVHENTVRVQMVFPWEAVEPDLLQLGSPEVASVDRNEYYNFPSLWAIEKILQRRGLPKIKFEFNPIERKLKIDPMPEEADLTYYYVSVEHVGWTLAAVPADFEDLVIMGTTWRCLEQITLFKTTLGGIQREGGFVDYPADRLKPYIDSKRDEFFNELRLKAMLFNK